MFFNASSQQNFIEGQNNTHAETYEWPPPGRRRRHPAGELSDDSNLQLYFQIGSRFMNSLTLSPNSTSSSFPSSPVSELESLESEAAPNWPLPGQSYNPFQSNYDPIYQHQSNSLSSDSTRTSFSGGRFMQSTNYIDTSDATGDVNGNTLDEGLGVDENNNNSTPRNFMANYDMNNNEFQDHELNNNHDNAVDLNNNFSNDNGSSENIYSLAPSSRFNTGLS